MESKFQIPKKHNRDFSSVNGYERHIVVHHPDLRWVVLVGLYLILFQLN